MLTAKDLEKYHQAAERILNAMDNSPVPISWHEMDRMALQSVIAKELILIDKEVMEYNNGRVIQCRGSHNCGMPASVKAFVAAFEKLMKEREEKMERKCG